jgi:CHAT domain-containing protein
MILFRLDVIVELAELGVSEKKGEWLDIAKIIYDQKNTGDESMNLAKIDNPFHVEGTEIVKINRFKLILKEMRAKRKERAKKKFDLWIEQSRNRIRTGNNSGENKYNLRLEQHRALIDGLRLSLLGSMNTVCKPGKITGMKKRIDRNTSFMYNKLFEMIAQLPPTEISKKFLTNFYRQFQETVLLSLENKYYDAGFDNAERIRARRFLTKLGNELYKRKDDEEDNIRIKRQDYISRLSALQIKIYFVDEKANGNKLEELIQQYRTLLNDFEIFEFNNRPKISFSSLFGNYSNSPEVLTLDKLRRTLDNEIAIYYFIANGQVHVFVISSMYSLVIPLEASEKEINRTVNRYLLNVKKNNTANVTKYGKKLYQMLFKPLKKAMRGKRNILIVPDGNLALIPFESFVIDDDTPGKPVYLLEKYKIKYIQSASTLSMVRRTNQLIIGGDPEIRRYMEDEQYRDEVRKKGRKKGKKNKKARKRRKKRIPGRFVGFGDPAYGSSDNLDRLEASGEEVEAIAALFKKKTSPAPIVYLREKATEDNAKLPGLIDYDYIHFSCHGVLKDNFQSLVLSRQPGSCEDGYLTLMEIGHCDYNAKLVVLSACETGTGEVQKGEGVTGLTRAVMVAGTPAVVSTLWNVDDIGTKELMVKFYKNILEKKMSKEDALRAAKLEMIKSEQYSSPYYWSAFVMYGE